MKSKIYKSSLILTSLLGVFSFFLSCKSDSSVRIIRLGHGLDVTHSVHQAMLQTDTYLKELSQGKMRLQIYPNQYVGSTDDNLGHKFLND